MPEECLKLDELLKYYKTRLSALALSVGLGIVFLEEVAFPYVVSQLGANHWFASLLGYATSRLAIVVILAAGEFVIRKYLWKIERSELDLSGNWTGITTFDKVRIGKPIKTFTTDYKVRIQQDCLSIRILPSTGSKFVNWGSLAIELADKDTLRYAYWVKYSDRSRFPLEAVGFEEVHVTERDEKDRPVELTGRFDHCARGQTPVYSGSVKFIRSKNGKK